MELHSRFVCRVCVALWLSAAEQVTNCQQMLCVRGTSSIWGLREYFCRRLKPGIF